jgi:hypothetical protein
MGEQWSKMRGLGRVFVEKARASRRNLSDDSGSDEIYLRAICEGFLLVSIVFRTRFCGLTI